MSKTFVNSILKENESLRAEVRELRRRCQFLELRKEESGSSSALRITTLMKKVSVLESELNSLSHQNSQVGYVRNNQSSNVKTILIDGEPLVSEHNTDAWRRSSFDADVDSSNPIGKQTSTTDRDPEILSFCFEISDGISKLSPPSPMINSQFEDSNHRGSNVFAVNLYKILVQEMGASSLIEVLSTITERDLINFGIPLVKARLVMQHIVERGSVILDEVMEEKRARRKLSKCV